MEYDNSEIIIRARLFATAAHYAVGQKRRYTGDPYIIHPTSVAYMVAEVGGSYEMVAAAFLHDVVEDTEVTIDIIRDEFGGEVAKLVDGLTDVSKPSDGNRKFRKNLDRLHLANQSNECKTIKLADLIDNSRSIITHDPVFAKVYMQEMSELLWVLKGGNTSLFNMATDIVDNYFKGRCLH